MKQQKTKNKQNWKTKQTKKLKYYIIWTIFPKWFSESVSQFMISFHNFTESHPISLHVLYLYFMLCNCISCYVFRFLIFDYRFSGLFVFRTKLWLSAISWPCFCYLLRMLAVACRFTSLHRRQRFCPRAGISASRVSPLKYWL